MRKIKILSLIFAILFVCLNFGACAKTVTAHVYLTVIEVKNVGGVEKETLICGPFWADIKGTEKNPPTVLQATREILEANNIKYTYDEDTASITSIKNKKESNSRGVVTGWIFKLYTNGEETEPNTRAKDTEIYDDDGIIYYLTSWANEDVQGTDDENQGSDAEDENEDGLEGEDEEENEDEADD